MKLMSLIALCTTFAISMTFFAGCSDTGSSSGKVTSSKTVDSVADEQPETDEEWHNAMIKKSLYTYGNSSLVQEKIKKAQAGEDVTIAYLGGSITEGLTAGSNDCYAKLTYDHFAQAFGTGNNVKYCNAGLSGTPSKLGILRLERDVLQYNPDICFIEFAVNDGSDGEHQSAYESIVRELLQRNIAVVLLFSITETDYTAQDYMKQIGNYYKLPMISYADALRYMFQNGKMTWKDFSDDQSHPNIEGHKMVAEMINYYFDNVMEQSSEKYVMPDIELVSKKLVGSHLYENTNLIPTSLGSWREGTSISRFKNGWSYVQGEGNKPLTFEFTGKNLYLIYKEVKQGKFGKCVIKVTCNGELFDTFELEPISTSGWGNPQILPIGLSSENAKYEIEISMAEGSEENFMEILAFGYTLDQ